MDEEVEALYIKWREKLLKICFGLMLIISAAEIILFLEHKHAGAVDDTAGYIFFNIAVPTVLNVLIWLTGCYTIRRTNVNLFIKNCIPVIMLTGFGGTMVIFHAGYSIVGSCLLIPIMLTVIYSNRIFTRIIIVTCNILITIDFFISLFRGFYQVEYYVFNYTISMLIYIAGCILVKALMIYESDIKSILRRNISEKQLLKEKLKQNPLTGLYTLEAFKTMIEQKVKEENKPVSVSVIRFDHKEIAPRIELIQEFAQIIRMKTGLYGFASYFGRGEFALAFSGGNKQHIKDMVDDIRRAFQRDTTVKKEEFDLISFTACISEYNSMEGETVEEFLQKMEQSLIRAQSIGGGRDIVL